MIKINNKTIIDIYVNNRIIKEVRKGVNLIWQKVNDIIDILCCFSNGYWIDQYPWEDNTSWKD